MPSPEQPLPEAARFVVDRRTNRVEIPPCPACERQKSEIVLRTSLVMYARCPTCANVQIIRKPEPQ